MGWFEKEQDIDRSGKFVSRLCSQRAHHSECLSVLRFRGISNGRAPVVCQGRFGKEDGAETRTVYYSGAIRGVSKKDVIDMII